MKRPYAEFQCSEKVACSRWFENISSDFDLCSNTLGRIKTCTTKTPINCLHVVEICSKGTVETDFIG